MIPVWLWASALIITGLTLLALDVKTFLGHGVVGLVGAVLAGWGTLAAWQSESGFAISLVLTASTVVASLLVAAALRSRRARELVHTGAIAGQPSELAATADQYIGLSGVAESDLRPSGVARLAGRRLDVVAADGAYVTAGTPVVVIRVAQNSIIVKTTDTGEKT